MAATLKEECGHRYSTRYGHSGEWRQLKLRHKFDVPRYERREVQLEAAVKLWFEAKQRKQTAHLHEAALARRELLRELEAMLEEEDEPDFLHRPTKYAYDTALESIENAYTHYLCSAPAPATAPDGDGGLIVEWKSGQHEVRLIVAPSEDQKSYVYSRGDKSAQIDYDTSGFILAQRLRSTFAD
jgi:hypothetical protein